MVKYSSKGNLPQKADYYAMLNRSDARWRDSVKQGRCSAGNGTTAGYTLTNTIAMAGDWSILICFDLLGLPAAVAFLLQQVVTVPSIQRFYIQIGPAGDLVPQIGTGPGISVGKVAVGKSYCLKMVYNSSTGKINGTLQNLTNGTSANLTEYTVAGLTTTNSTWRVMSRIAGDGVNGNLNALVIWNSQKALADMTVDSPVNCIVCHPNNGTLHDVSGNNNHGINSGLDLTGRSDYSSYYCDEYGFAVKSGIIYPIKLDGSGYAGLVGDPDKIYYPTPYPNTFTGNWHELTHAYFDKSNTDIWEDFVRESINYISKEPNYWHISELTQAFIDTYVKAAYADKIFVGLDATDSEYAGAVMVFESGITADQLKDLNFWRKRKYFPSR